MQRFFSPPTFRETQPLSLAVKQNVNNKSVAAYNTDALYDLRINKLYN